MRRTLDIDPANCSRCEGRLAPIALITREDVVERILSHLNVRIRADEAALVGLEPRCAASASRSDGLG
jgi:hypothetical protein